MWQWLDIKILVQSLPLRTLSALHLSLSEPSWSPPWTWGLSSSPDPAWSSCLQSRPGFSRDHSWLLPRLTSSSPVIDLSYYPSFTFGRKEESRQIHLKVCLMLVSPHSELSSSCQERLNRKNRYNSKELIRLFFTWMYCVGSWKIISS